MQGKGNRGMDQYTLLQAVPLGLPYQKVTKGRSQFRDWVPPYKSEFCLLLSLVT